LTGSAVRFAGKVGVDDNLDGQAEFVISGDGLRTVAQSACCAHRPAAPAV
jgi:hypothetical protein